MLNELPFHVAIGITLTIDAALLAFFAWAFHSPRFRRYLLREPMEMRVSRRSFLVNIGSNGLLSVVATLGLIYGLSPWTMNASPAPWWRIGLQFVAILVVYDFGYYFMHRLMHAKRLMPLVHAVHHRARFPSALESLYQSPIELLAGLGMLMLATLIVGPVHYAAFVGAFFVFSTLNIVIHTGMRFPHRAFWLLNLLTEKHFKHHYNKHGHNFASVTPIPDLIFRTAI